MLNAALYVFICQIPEKCNISYATIAPKLFTRGTHGIMPELQSKQTTVINLDLPLFEKAVFFRLELELTEILRGSNFRFFVAGKRFVSA